MARCKWICRILSIILFSIYSPDLIAQNSLLDISHLLGMPKSHVVHKASKAPVIDGNINDNMWEEAQWSDLFVDIEGTQKPAPKLETRVKMVWDDSCLYIAADIKEPHVWATLQKHDAIIYHDNDFEVFLDPENNVHEYFEIEVNAFNTILDLFLSKPYRNGGQALLNWNLNGLKSAVKIQGTINDPTDLDEGWTVEMAIPFRSVSIGNLTKVPNEGIIWRINFSRVQWETEIINEKYSKKRDEKGKFLPEHNWVWSPQGIINMHYPERWGYLIFSDKRQVHDFELPFEEKLKQYLWLIYYKQQEYHHKNKKFADSLNALEIKETMAKNELNITIEAGNYQFIAILWISDKKALSINQEGFMSQVKF